MDGGAGGSTNYFALNDIQNRLVIRPVNASGYFNGVATDHYENYGSVTNYLRPGATGVFMPRKCCTHYTMAPAAPNWQEIWEAFRTATNSGGMFLWSWDDAGIQHDDTGVMDVSGTDGPDGIVGPYREKEASYYTYKMIYSPVQIGLTNLTTFAGALAVSNRFDFTDLSQCHFNWQLGWFFDPTDSTNNFSPALSPAVCWSGRTVETFPARPCRPARENGSLALPAFPANWTNYDALRLTATDPFGNNIYTWTVVVAYARANSRPYFGRGFSDSASHYCRDQRHGNCGHQRSASVSFQQNNGCH